MNVRKTQVARLRSRSPPRPRRPMRRGYCMAPVSPRRAGAKPRADAGPDAGLPVGHVYLDVRRRLLYCLDDTARRLRGEGVPFIAVDPARPCLTTLAGQPVADADLPLRQAWHEGRPAEAA